MTQTEFDFLPSRSASACESAGRDGNPNESPARIYKRTTTLTTDKASYLEVAGMAPGEERSIYCVNDIVSSAYGGASSVHHQIRRVDLMRSAMRGNFRKVKVRWNMDGCVNCLVTGFVGAGDSDGCSFRVRVCKDPAFLPRCSGEPKRA